MPDKWLVFTKNTPTQRYKTNILLRCVMIYANLMVLSYIFLIQPFLSH